MANTAFSVRSNRSARIPTSASVADLYARVTQQVITALEAGGHRGSASGAATT